MNNDDIRHIDDYEPTKDGLFTFIIHGKPNVAGKVKIFLWNLVLFPIIKISWKAKR